MLFPVLKYINKSICFFNTNFIKRIEIIYNSMIIRLYLYIFVIIFIIVFLKEY